MKKFLCFLLALVTDTAFANESHKQLAAMSEADRRVMLSLFMRENGEACFVTKTFYQGSDSKGTASWNVACSNGKAFVIGVANDAGGSTSILGCEVLKAVARVECFKPFSQQR